MRSTGNLLDENDFIELCKKLIEDEKATTISEMLAYIDDRDTDHIGKWVCK